MPPVAAAAVARRSVRAFTAEPVPGEAIEAILAAALRAPSGGNLQPWHIHVVRGGALARLTAAMRLAQEAGEQEVPNHPVYPEGLWEPYRSRRFENGEDLYRTIGIERSDKAGRLRQLAQNYQLFGAPAGLFFAIDRRMGRAQWIDLGMVMQTVMLVALEHGLATCPQAAWALWPDTLGELLGLDEHMMIAAGMALGHEDTAHPINTLRTTRQSLDEGVTWHD
ncbi:nitroreductase [Sphingomonas colocasiae]|uniref:Nitroreductase n=2 Tax=Sphingomonas colocasiae TaxID=1848973 RepID=A0ABS7PT10_9SPHN|nr:nitroreductase [Sphingomonas colocasiae]